MSGRPFTTRKRPVSPGATPRDATRAEAANTTSPTTTPTASDLRPGITQSGYDSCLADRQRQARHRQRCGDAPPRPPERRPTSRPGSPSWAPVPPGDVSAVDDGPAGEAASSLKSLPAPADDQWVRSCSGARWDLLRRPRDAGAARLEFAVMVAIFTTWIILSLVMFQQATRGADTGATAAVPMAQPRSPTAARTTAVPLAPVPTTSAPAQSAPTTTAPRQPHPRQRRLRQRHPRRPHPRRPHRHDHDI